MILFFSATGNSKFVANKIAEYLADKTISLNERIKSENYSLKSFSNPLIIIVPTYAWRIPNIVNEYLLKTPLDKYIKTYFILTCGDDSARADIYVKKLCKHKKLTYMGLKSIIMPENYTAMFNIPDQDEAQKIIKKALPDIEKTAEIIKKGQFIEEKHTGIIKSAIINPLFYTFIVNAKGFYTTKNCTGCAKCAEVCPLNNIHIKQNIPVWDNHCTHCMACINRCPFKAIEYKNASKNKSRYFLDTDNHSTLLYSR